MAGFIFGGDTGLTYEGLQRRRKIAEQLMQGKQQPRNALEGLGSAAESIAGALMDRKLDKKEGQMRDDFNAEFAGLFGGDFGGVQATPSSYTAPSRPGMVSAPDGTPEFITYSNQNATRNKPLDPKMYQALSFLPELGVTMEVISGGQDAQGEGSRRTGSTRHDHGGAADVDFYRDGRKLDWNNPDDIPLFQEIVRRGRANGLTGFGAGDDYMGPGRMHIGFGDAAVWGSGGKGENAPEWLRSAFSGAAPSATTVSSSAPSGGGSSSNIQRIAQIMAMANNPLANPAQQKVAQIMLQREMQSGDPMRQMELERAQLELEALRNPQPGYSQVRGAELGLTGPQADMMFNRGPDGKITQIGGSGTTINNNMPGAGPTLGKLSTDYGYVLDPETGQPRIDPQTGLPMSAPVPGSPAAREIATTEEKKSERERQKAIGLGPTLTNIQMNIDEIQDGGFPVTGLIGAAAGQISGTAASDWRVRNEQITTEAALNEVQNMRDNSPTGGAVGQLTDSERQALAVAASGLSNAQSKGEYIRAAETYRKTMLDTAYGQGNWSIDDKGQVSLKSSAPPGQGGGFANATMADLLAVDIISLTPAQEDEWERRMLELQGGQ